MNPFSVDGDEDNEPVEHDETVDSFDNEKR